MRYFKININIYFFNIIYKYQIILTAKMYRNFVENII